MGVPVPVRSPISVNGLDTGSHREQFPDDGGATPDAPSPDPGRRHMADARRGADQPLDAADQPLDAADRAALMPDDPVDDEPF